MSEYQYYEFVAIDTPLNARQLTELRALSTRARITPTSFVNTYEWGNFKGDPRLLMERYFDAFLYLTNWGTRQIMFRLPSSLLDLQMASRYCPSESACVWASRECVVVELNREEAVDEWEEDGEGWLGSIVPARSELATGDRRLLYLAWLLSVGAGDLADEALEPQVPPGLTELSAPLQALVDFLRLDRDLLAVAGEASEPLSTREPSASELNGWVAELSGQEKDALLAQLVGSDDPRPRWELLRRFREETRQEQEVTRPRSVAELLEAAAQNRDRRAQLAAQRTAQEEARRARAQAAAREQHLTALALRQDQAWQRARAAIDTRRPGEYDAVIELLKDLQVVSEREGSPDAFEQQIEDLRQAHWRKISLLERLERAGLGPGTGSSPRLRDENGMPPEPGE